MLCGSSVLHGLLDDADATPLLMHIPEAWLDLVPFMAARALLNQGHNPARVLRVRLQGADYELCYAPLGAVAATPLINFAAPATRPAHCIFAEQSHGG